METDYTKFIYIAENLRKIKEKMHEAALRAGRPDASLLAVTKGATDDEVRALLHFGGIIGIGENRASLFNTRADIVEETGASAERHFIGSLQTNKVKAIIDRVSLIHSVDSPELLKEIEKQAKKRDITVPVLLEINSGREEAKGGVMPEEIDDFHALAVTMPHIAVRGIMTMAPNCENKEDYHRYFGETRVSFERIRDKGGFTGTPVLSMGMSNSYEIAVEEGATVVRVGTSLFRKDQT